MAFYKLSSMQPLGLDGARPFSMPTCSPLNGLFPRAGEHPTLSTPANDSSARCPFKAATTNWKKEIKSPAPPQ